ncbi:membrane protein [Corynebacterium renale]|nr:membrane protein [Corynebacterium renale]
MVWRVFLLLVGIGIMSFGVSLTVVAGIGTTTNSSLPVALAAITDLSVGQLTIVFNFVYVAVQILLLRSRYQWIQLLQLVTGLIFGLLIDATAPLVEPLRPEHYWQELGLA